jgi:hypothetical protein
MKLWKNRHAEATKEVVEKRRRQTHKAVAMQLAPYLRDMHEHPPLAQTFNFLDTVQALDVPALPWRGTCLSLSCALPGVPGRKSTLEQGAEQPCVPTQAACLEDQKVAPTCDAGDAIACCHVVSGQEAADRNR